MTATGPVRRTMLLTTMVVAATAGCGQPDPAATPTPSGSVARGSPVSAARSEWVAVFHVAGDPRDLDDDTEELMRTVPHSLIVGPVGCHEGLADAVDAAPGDYFSGVVAPSEAELDRAVEDARASPAFGEPVFRGQVVVVC